MQVMEPRTTLHALVDELPEQEIPAARRYLEFLRQQTPEPRSVDPLRRALENAPLDDEELTAEDLAAIREGLEEKARGEVIPHEEIERRLSEIR
jgi:predicted transcriptional regulator